MKIVWETERSRYTFDGETFSIREKADAMDPFEYLCGDCGQLRLSFAACSTCGNCGSANIRMGPLGTLEKP